MAVLIIHFHLLTDKSKTEIDLLCVKCLTLNICTKKVDFKPRLFWTKARSLTSQDGRQELDTIALKTT